MNNSKKDKKWKKEYYSVNKFNDYRDYMNFIYHNRTYCNICLSPVSKYKY